MLLKMLFQKLWGGGQRDGDAGNRFLSSSVRVADVQRPSRPRRDPRLHGSRCSRGFSCFSWRSRGSARPAARAAHPHCYERLNVPSLRRREVKRNVTLEELCGNVWSGKRKNKKHTHTHMEMHSVQVRQRKSGLLPVSRRTG